jgi:tellurite resistance protein TerC
MQAYLASVVGGYSLWSVAIFAIVIITALIVDLKAHGDDKPISVKNAAIWSGIWIAVSLAFAGYLGVFHGMEKSSLFLAGYLLEKSLAVDNLFVFMAIFASFGVKDAYQHRVLYYGIIGALVLRFLFIGLGTSLALMSEWVLLAFGVIVLYTAYAMWKSSSSSDDDEEIDYTNHAVVRWTKKIFPVHPYLDGHNFLTHVSGKWAVTPLFLCLVCLEVSDVMFAFDSVPAVIAVTREPFLVYTSNIFAILGLRSMYFLLTAAKRYLCHLETAIIFILVFIGAKMIFGTFNLFHISALASLAIVGALLTGGVLASLAWPEKPSN